MFCYTDKSLIYVDFFQIGGVIEKLKSQLTEKGQELVKFREEYNIRVRGEKDDESPAQKTPASTGGVLVASK